MTSGIREGWMGLDVGPETTTQFVAVVEKSSTLVWNGCVLHTTHCRVQHSVYYERALVLIAEGRTKHLQPCCSFPLRIQCLVQLHVDVLVVFFLSLSSPLTSVQWECLNSLTLPTVLRPCWMQLSWQPRKAPPPLLVS